MRKAGILQAFQIIYQNEFIYQETFQLKGVHDF